MALVMSAVVARDDDNSVVIDSGILQGLYDTSHTTVDTDKVVVVILCVPSFFMSNAINAIETGGKENRFFVLDVFLQDRTLVFFLVDLCFRFYIEP